MTSFGNAPSPETAHVPLSDYAYAPAVNDPVRLRTLTLIRWVAIAGQALVAGKKVSGYRSVFIDASSVVQVVVASIVLKESDARGGRDGFATDTDISASAAILNERELVDVDNAWLDSDTAVNLEDQEMESGKVWDQFEVNYKLTGRVATYDENFYTTRLDMSKVGRLARKKDD